ncbi:hypothetical protein [Glaciihabitans sp. UYNi722]|uniref:hypothetical protein n=1 Tax=Glaciihabitans sp. UYNi722 TaxID=3156344 RepID=UPI003398A653
MTPELRIVTRTQGANADLKSGAIRSASVSLDFIEVDPLVDAFRRMVRTIEFDASEMSLTTYLCARQAGVPITALPIFLVRGLHHGAMTVRDAAGITTPADLEGRRVAVSRGYSVTTGVWAREILASEYDVDLHEVNWLPTAEEHVTGTPLPRNVPKDAVGLSVEALLEHEDVDAVVGVSVDGPGLSPLLPDADQLGFASLVHTGLYPINHLIVVRDDVLTANPGLALDLFDAFAEAKNRYVARLIRDDFEPMNANDRMLARVFRETGSDPLPYGIASNAVMLERLIASAHAQGLLTHAPSVEELFAAETLHLSA